MRRRAGQMGDAMAAQPRQEIRHRFRPAPTGPASAAQQRAQQDLQAAIAADVIESAPDDVLARRAGWIAPLSASRLCATILGAPVVPEVNITHSRLRDGASAGPASGSNARLETATRFNRQRRIVAYDHVSIAARAITRGRCSGFHVGRGDHDARGDAVQRDQRQGGKQLVMGAEQDMGAGQHRHRQHSGLPRPAPPTRRVMPPRRTARRRRPQGQRAEVQAAAASL